MTSFREANRSETNVTMYRLTSRAYCLRNACLDTLTEELWEGSQKEELQKRTLQSTQTRLLNKKRLCGKGHHVTQEETKNAICFPNLRTGKEFETQENAEMDIRGTRSVDMN